jgi:hypothetical protein
MRSIEFARTLVLLDSAGRVMEAQERRIKALEAAVARLSGIVYAAPRVPPPKPGEPPNVRI